MLSNEHLNIKLKNTGVTANPVAKAKDHRRLDLIPRAPAAVRCHGAFENAAMTV